MGAQIADIERLRRLFQKEKVVLIGHSFGGLLASLYAMEFPSNVAALVAVCPAPLLKFPVEGKDLFALIEERLPAAVVEEYREFKKRYFDFKNLFKQTEDSLIELGNEFRRFYGLAVSVPQVRHSMSSSMIGGWVAFAMYLSMGMECDYTPYAANVRCPVLVIHGEKDIQTVKQSKSYGVFPNFEFQTVDAGHFPFYENPKELEKIIETFLVKAKVF